MDILRNALELVETGGPVMIPLGILSAWMWIMIVWKADWIRRVRRREMSAREAMACLRAMKGPDGATCCPRAGALCFFLDRYFEGRDRLRGAPDQLFFEVAIRRQVRDLYRYIPAIMTLAAAAPLLGLLGTVTGMVETFRVIGLFGMGNAQAMASGIKEALITTQAGLLIAIPGMLIGQAMRKKVRAIHNDILVFHRAVSQWLEKEWRQCTE
jgi:biopolymer transport protein ExbB